MSNSNQDHSNKSGDEKLDMQSPDLVQQNIEKLADLFPNCVSEGVVDFDLLKQELNHAVVEGNKERYRLEWPGKREAIVTANLPTTKTLRPVREDSVDFDNTENIYIEGDNLEVLKLLQESYLGKIKMIYIDPPYNTGNDFVYKDNFAKDKEEELFESGQKDELSQRLVANPETAGRYHSDWLSMIYPRLKLARNLLKDDGVVFISIDDNEQANLKRLCDEVFGEQNFVANVIRRSKIGGGADNKHFAQEADYIVCYAKSISFLHTFYAQRTEDDLKRYKEADDKGPYFWDTYSRSGLASGTEESLYYAVTFPDGSKKSDRWRRSKERLAIDLAENEAKFVKTTNGWNVHFKQRLSGEGKRPRQIMFDGYGNTSGTEIINQLFQKKYIFDYPKPLNLVEFLVHIGSKDEDIVLDFFSGSATTAHAIFINNSFHKTNRKFILIQIPEPTDKNSEAYKFGFKNICEIGKERIRRAAKKIKDETGADIDYGFRVYRLDESNMQDVYYRPQELDQSKMDLFADNVKPDRTEDDLLAQVMLDWGLPLSLKIDQANVAGKNVFKVAENSLFACFDKGIDETFAKEIAKEKPLRIVFKDAGFKDDTAKTNVKQLLKQLSPETEMKVL